MYSVFQDSELKQFKLQDLFQSGLRRKFAKRAMVFHQGDDSDAVYWIESGKLKVYVTDDAGRISILRLMGPGELLGELALFDQHTRSASVEAIEESRLIALSLENLRPHLAQNLELMNLFNIQLSTRVRDLTEELMQTRNCNAYTCFRSKLYALAETLDDGSMRLQQKFTQQELGEFIGTTRENINRFVKGLKQGGYLCEDPDGHLKIMKPLPQSW